MNPLSILLLALLASLPQAYAQDFAPADRLAIERLRAQQRIEQQQVEIEQWQRQRALERQAPPLGDDEVRRRLDMQRNAFQTERQIQALRFQVDEHRLIQSLPRQPLQPVPAPGVLRLPEVIPSIAGDTRGRAR